MTTKLHISSRLWFLWCGDMELQHNDLSDASAEQKNWIRALAIISRMLDAHWEETRESLKPSSYEWKDCS